MKKPTRSPRPSMIAKAVLTAAALLSPGASTLAGDWQTTTHREGDATSGPKVTGRTHKATGMASYYWQGQETASGERFNKRALTAAHRTLPFGTRVRVTRVDTGASVVVRINDRGPFTKGRIIDLSEKAAETLRMTGRGTAPVKLEVVGR